MGGPPAAAARPAISWSAWRHASRPPRPPCIPPQVPLTSISAPATVPYAFVDFLGLGDRVHDVSPYVSSPCGQALLECANSTAPDFSLLRCGGAGVRVCGARRRPQRSTRPCARARRGMAGCGQLLAPNPSALTFRCPSPRPTPRRAQQHSRAIPRHPHIMMPPSPLCAATRPCGTPPSAPMLTA